MRKIKVFLIAFLVTGFGFSQIVYESGYYIDNQGNKIEGFIKNVDWQMNPNQFSFKKMIDGSSENISIEDAQEFVISGDSDIIFKRFNVDIDRSLDVVNSLSVTRAPELTKEVLFLKTLVKGEATLYYYEDTNLRRFFYAIGENEAKQLVYKKYLTANGYLGENNLFKQQLLNELNIPGYSPKKIESLEYKKSDLVPYFKDYNSVNGEVFEELDSGRPKNKVNLNLSFRIGATSQKFFLDAPNSFSRDTDFGRQLSPRLGLELESILPFNKNKWGFFVGLNFKNFQAETDAEQEGVTRSAETEFVVWDIPVGVRHYFFLPNKSKLFVNGTFNVVIIPESTVDGGFGRTLTVGRSTGLAFGAGYELKNDFGVEFRYNTYEDILTFTERTSSFNGMSLVFFYKI